MKISWGLKITLLYCGFVAIIVTLVVGSLHQHFDLVSDHYYADEIAYQKVIDADKNEVALSSPVSVHADAGNIVLGFPAELHDKELSGTIHFYSPANAAWDKIYNVKVANNSMIVPRAALHNTLYTVKISFSAGGKAYYQESQLNLHS